jgi:hypothetical protein
MGHTFFYRVKPCPPATHDQHLHVILVTDRSRLMVLRLTPPPEDSRTTRSRDPVQQED